MKRRSKAREVAIQMLYLKDLNSDAETVSIHEAISKEIPNSELQKFAWILYSGVMEHKTSLDEKINEVAQNWTLNRMAPTDRNVLRLGAYELLYTDTHYRIVLDESIEMARRFGNKQSGQFVNGILDKLIPEKKRQTDQPEIDGPDLEISEPELSEDE